MRWKYAIITAIAVTAAYSLVFVITLITACTPTRAYWKAWNPEYREEYTCRQSKFTNSLSGIMSVVSDFYSVLLPCLMLHNFEAPRRQKIALNIIFCLGLIVVAAGSVRTYYLHQLGHSIDLTWTGYDVFIWAQLEVQLSLICASAPALRVFFRKYLSDPVLRAITSGRSNSRRGSRRTSQRLTEDSSNRGKSPLPLSSNSTGKPGTLSTLSEVDVERAATPHGGLRRSMSASPDDWEYPLESLDGKRPPIAYTLHEKQSSDDPFSESRQLHPRSRYNDFNSSRKM